MRRRGLETGLRISRTPIESVAPILKCPSMSISALHNLGATL